MSERKRVPGTSGIGRPVDLELAVTLAEVQAMAYCHGFSVAIRMACELGRRLMREQGHDARTCRAFIRKMGKLRS